MLGRAGVWFVGQPRVCESDGEAACDVALVVPCPRRLLPSSDVFHHRVIVSCRPNESSGSTGDNVVLTPGDTPLLNKLEGEVSQKLGWRCDRTLRDVKLGYPVVGRVPGGNGKHMEVGMVQRRGSRDGVAVACNSVGRKSGECEPAMQVFGGHHIGLYLGMPNGLGVGMPHYVRSCI